VCIERACPPAGGVVRANLVEFGMFSSMRHKCDCCYNAPIENDAARADSFQYIEVLSFRSRRHSTLGCRSPTQCLQHWITAGPSSNWRLLTTLSRHKTEESSFTLSRGRAQ